MIEKRYAVLVGVADYSKVDGADDLRCTNQDAVELCKILKESCGFASDKVRLFCDSTGKNKIEHSAPTYSDILSATEVMCTSACEDDTILFFFAGHGIELQGEPYLLTNDTRMNVVADTAIPVKKLNELMKRSRAKKLSQN